MIGHVVAPFDGSAVAECTLPFIAAVAKAFSARVTLLRVLEHPEGAGGPAFEALEWEIKRAEAYANLAKLKATLEAQGCTAAIEILPERPAGKVAHYASRDDVDLVVLASHGAGSLHGASQAITIHKVIASTHASVLVVPASRYHATDLSSVAFRKMLLPLDCSQRAECILPAATKLAETNGAQLILAHVVVEPEMPRRMPPSSEDLELVEKLIERNRREAEHYLRELQNRLTVSGKVDVRLVVAPHRTQALRDLARQDQVDLIVLCAHGSTGDPHQRYGGVAAKLLQESETPVLILQDLAAIVRPQVIDAMAEAERPGH